MATWMTYEEALEELRVPRSTMRDWRREGRAPRFTKLPGGQLRIRREDLDAWLETLEHA